MQSCHWPHCRPTTLFQSALTTRPISTPPTMHGSRGAALALAVLFVVAMGCSATSTMGRRLLVEAATPLPSTQARQHSNQQQHLLSSAPRKLAMDAAATTSGVSSSGPVKAGDIDPESIRNLAAFPAASGNQARFVLHMPHLATPEAEANTKVEIQVGKILLLEPRNRYWYSGTLKPQSVPGWGFTLFNLTTLGVMASTRIAVDPAEPKVDRFVQVSTIPPFRYNTRLPLVLYVPSDAEVRVRYWHADSETSAVPRG